MNEVRLTAPAPETRLTGQQSGGRIEPGVASANPGVVAPAESVAVAAQLAGSSEAGQAKEVRLEQQHQQREQLESAVAQLNDYVQSIQRDLRFQLDGDTGQTVVTVVDRNSEEVVRQIPDDVALRLARNLSQDEPVQLFNAKV